MLNYIQIQEKINAGTLKYYPVDLEKHEKMQAEISQFVTCEVHAIVYQDNENTVKHFTTIIENAICGDIEVWFRDKSGYLFSCSNINKLTYMEYLSVGTIGKSIPEQNKIFKLSKKKIDFEIERLEKIYFKALEKSKQKEQEVKDFYAKLEQLGGIHQRNGNTGYVDFKHYELRYTVHNDGYIEQIIRLRYNPHTPIDFLLTQK